MCLFFMFVSCSALSIIHNVIVLANAKLIEVEVICLKAKDLVTLVHIHTERIEIAISSERFERE